MLRSGFLWLLITVPSCAGCAMCCGVDDANYAAYGGRWQRADMQHGRVGSIFAPAGPLMDSGSFVQDEVLDESLLPQEGQVEPPLPEPELPPNTEQPPVEAPSITGQRWIQGQEELPAGLQAIDEMAAPIPDFDLE